MNGQRYIATLAGVALLCGLWISAADAKPGKGKGGGNSSQTTEVTTSPTSSPTRTRTEKKTRTQTTTTTTTTLSTTTFTSSQRSNLTGLVNGTIVRNDVLTEETRILIREQISSLPPGIQKRLARGKGLPPGIAKKVVLPKTVNSYLNISEQYDLIVVGSNVVLYDTAKSVVMDLITRIL